MYWRGCCQNYSISNKTAAAGPLPNYYALSQKPVSFILELTLSCTLKQNTLGQWRIKFIEDTIRWRVYSIEMSNRFSHSTYDRAVLKTTFTKVNRSVFGVYRTWAKSSQISKKMRTCGASLRGKKNYTYIR